VKTHYLNFGPRIGFAQKIGANTVVLGAYGIFYAHAGGVGGRTNGRQGLSQIGFTNSGSASSTVTGQPAHYWDNGIPGAALGCDAGTGLRVTLRIAVNSNCASQLTQVHGVALLGDAEWHLRTIHSGESVLLL